MLVIGLTGGIGVGKTTVSNLFSNLNVPIIDADVVAREVTKPGENAYTSIVTHFSNNILLPDQTLNRSKLRDIIFNNVNERKWLENLLHPIIRQQIQDKVMGLKGPYCIVVIPLLAEVNSYPFIDRILVIDSELSLQLERVRIRDKTSNAKVEAVINTQIDRETRLKFADDIIINNGSLEALGLQVQNLHQKYLQLSTLKSKLTK